MTALEHRELRIRLGLSVGAESRLLGVNRRTVERWDSGDRPVSAEARRLLRLLELELDTGTPDGAMAALLAMVE